MAKKTKQNTPVSNTATKINILLIAGALVITSGIIWYALKGPAQTVQREVLPKPNVTTLDPARFTGRTRSAYQGAKEVPQVLAQLPCFSNTQQFIIRH